MICLLSYIVRWTSWHAYSNVLYPSQILLSRQHPRQRSPSQILTSQVQHPLQEPNSKFIKAQPPPNHPKSLRTRLSTIQVRTRGSASTVQQPDVKTRFYGAIPDSYCAQRASHTWDAKHCKRHRENCVVSCIIGLNRGWILDCRDGRAYILAIYSFCSTWYDMCFQLSGYFGLDGGFGAVGRLVVDGCAQLVASVDRYLGNGVICSFSY